MMDFRDILPLSPIIWMSIGITFFAIVYRVCFSTDSKQDSIGWRPIPQPIRLPFIGNLLQIDFKKPLTSLNELGKAYRDVFRIDLPGTNLVIINSHRVYDEICDNKRFHKEPCGALLEARAGGGDGLFTSFTDEEAWGIAHRVLTPAYGQQGVKRYIAGMTSVTDSLIQKWHRSPDGYEFDPWEEFSLLSMDIFTQCAFSINFSAIEKQELPSFIVALTDFLSEAGQRAIRPSWMTKYIFRRKDLYYWKCIDEVQTTVTRIIKERAVAEKRPNDVLRVMLEETDHITGKMMSEQNRMYNTLALFGAGFEPMASLLSWFLVCLLQNPRCMHKLQEEIANRLQGRPVTEQDFEHLPYLTACIREVLRLYPSAPAHCLKLRKEAIQPEDPGLGFEQYHVKRSDIIRVNLMSIQRDPLVYGPDADLFRPERMLDESFSKLPRNAWKPFGTGVRMCLGRYFAFQEAYVVITTLLQNFDFIFVDGRCDYEIGATLILKPNNCIIKAVPKSPSEFASKETAEF